MQRRAGWTVAALLALAACGGGEEASDAAAGDTATVPTAATPDAPAAAPQGGMEMTATMSALANSGVTGEVSLTPQGDATQVTVRLSGLEPGTAHPGHIHRGSCASPGPVVAPLQEITADASGAGTMTATASVPGDSLMAGGHLVAYHPAGGGPPIVCGELPAHQM